MDIKDFTEIAKVLIDEEVNYLTLKSNLDDYKSKLIEITRLNIENDDHRENMHFSSGKAIGTTWAAMCIDDLLRTKRFVQGIYQAINELLKIKDQIHILYAGTGPFATLVLPIMALFPSEKVQFTLLEINPISFQYLQQLINKLNIDKYIKHVELADATSYKIKDPDSIDILLSETMQHALLREQQVPICYHLLSLLKSSTILIPKCIKLDLCLINPKKQMAHKLGESDEPYLKNLGTFYELSANVIRETLTKTIDFSEEYHFPVMTYRIPLDCVAFNTVSVLTEITVYKEKILNGESGLTIPYQLAVLSEEQIGKTIRVHYYVSQTPSIEFTID